MQDAILLVESHPCKRPPGEAAVGGIVVSGESLGAEDLAIEDEPVVAAQMFAQAVKALIKQFEQMRKIMRQVAQGRMPDLGALMRQSR